MGVNVQCESVIFNDLNPNVVGILQALRELDKEETIQIINDTIEHFNLSNVSEHGYDFYGCNSSKGVGFYNREHFNQLKIFFNQTERRDNYYYILLYVLVIFSFNNQIRFNNRGEFNLPVGKRDFNSKMQTKLNAFIDRLKEIDCNFLNVDFRNFSVEDLEENDFIYADPPYLITCATYNEQDGWNETLEKQLYELLDCLN